MDYCVVMDLPGGGRATVRMSGKRPPACLWCGKPSTKRCDFIVSPPAQVTHKRTCDAPMCATHAENISHEVDYCPEHVGEKREQA